MTRLAVITGLAIKVVSYLTLKAGFWSCVNFTELVFYLGTLSSEAYNESIIADMTSLCILALFAVGRAGLTLSSLFVGHKFRNAVIASHYHVIISWFSLLFSFIRFWKRLPTFEEARGTQRISDLARDTF